MIETRKVFKVAIAAATDIAEIARVYTKCYREMLTNYKLCDHPSYDIGAQNYIRSLLSSPANHAYLLVCDEKIVGALIYTLDFIHPLLLQKECFIWDIFILPEYRKTRATWTMWQHMVSTAKAHKCARLRGTTQNPEMIDYLNRGGGRVDGYIYAKEL